MKLFKNSSMRPWQIIEVLTIKHLPIIASGILKQLR